MDQILIPFKRGLRWETLLFLLLGSYFLWKAQWAPVGDFANYYYASLALLKGAFSPLIYDPYSFNVWVATLSSETVYVNYTPVPPLSILFYLPFALFQDIQLSKFLFGLFNLVFFAIALSRFLSIMKLKNMLFISLGALVFYTPIWNNFFQGQSYLFLLGCLLEGFRQWHLKRPIWAGLFWAIPIGLKIFPAVLLLFLFFQRPKKALLATMGFSFTLSFLPIAFIPFEVVTDYFLHILPRLFKGEINDPFTILYQSIRVLLNKSFVFDLHLNPYPFFNFPIVSSVLHLLFQGIVLAIMVFLQKKDTLTPFCKFALTFLGGLLLTGYGSTYSMLLLFLFFLAIPILWEKSIWAWGLAIVLAVGLNIPVFRLHDWPLLAQFPRLYMLLSLLITAAIKIKPKAHWSWGLAIIALLILKGIGVDKVFSEEGQYYLKDGSQGIIYEYRSQDKQMELAAFNRYGIQQLNMPTRDSIWEDANLKVIEQQIYWDGQQLTSSNSLKRLPKRLNKAEVIYLTDENRGIGFYTLRKIPLPSKGNRQ